MNWLRKAEKEEKEEDEMKIVMYKDGWKKKEEEKGVSHVTHNTNNKKEIMIFTLTIFHTRNMSL